MTKSTWKGGVSPTWGVWFEMNDSCLQRICPGHVLTRSQDSQDITLCDSHTHEMGTPAVGHENHILFVCRPCCVHGTFCSQVQDMRAFVRQSNLHMVVGYIYNCFQVPAIIRVLVSHRNGVIWLGTVLNFFPSSFSSHGKASPAWSAYSSLFCRGPGDQRHLVYICLAVQHVWYKYSHVFCSRCMRPFMWQGHVVSLGHFTNAVLLSP